MTTEMRGWTAVITGGANGIGFGMAQADVGDPDQVNAARDAFLDAFGGVDIACANAGHGSRELPVWEIPVE